MLQDVTWFNNNALLMIEEVVGLEIEILDLQNLLEKYF